MRSWPVRIKLFLIPTAAVFALAVMLWTLDLELRRPPRARRLRGHLMPRPLRRRLGDRLESPGASRSSATCSRISKGAAPKPQAMAMKWSRCRRACTRPSTAARSGRWQLRRSTEFLEFAQAAGGFGIFDLDLATAQLTGTPLFFELIGLRSRASSPSRATNGWRPCIPEDFETVVRELECRHQRRAASFRVEYRTLLAGRRHPLAGGARRGAARRRGQARPASSARSRTSPSASASRTRCAKPPSRSTSRRRRPASRPWT